MRRRDCLDERQAQAIPLRLISFREALEGVTEQIGVPGGCPVMSVPTGTVDNRKRRIPVYRRLAPG